MATLKDVAKEVGVSVATVSYVLNGKGSISEDVKKEIYSAVKKLGYRPNRSAQAMRTGRTKLIGLVLPDLTNPFFPELAQTIEKAARDEGVVVILIDCQNDIQAENDGFSLLRQQQVEGVIWCPTGSKEPSALKNINFPVVLIDRALTGFDAVLSNYRKGGELLAEYAIELGHKVVGMLSGPKEFESARQRREGFLNAAKGKLDIVWDIETPFSITLNKTARNRLKGCKVSLVVAGNDLIAIGAMEFLKEQGVVVPKQVSVLGFDDIPWSKIVTPKLTTISQPIESMGVEAVDLLMRKIQDPDKPQRIITLDVDLVVRASAVAKS